MKLHSGVLGLVALLAAVQLAAGQGTVIVQHSGYNDPASEGFSFGGGGQVGGVTNDLGYNAWFTTAVQDVIYVASLNDMTGESWELNVNMRVVTADANKEAFSVFLSTGPESFYLGFGSTANGDPEVTVEGSSLSPTYTLNGMGSTYNTYQLLYDVGSDTASFWINGVEQFGDIVGGPGEQPALEFYGGENAQANWNLVSLEIVPEPSALALVFLGGGVLIYARRKYRR